MKELNVNLWIQKSHDNAKNKGFYDVPTSKLRRLLLAIFELGEGFEHYRCNQRANIKEYKKMVAEDPNNQIIAFRMYIKDTFEEEIIDVAIRLFDFMGSIGLEMEPVKINIVGIAPNDPEFWLDSKIYEIIRDLVGIVKSNPKTMIFKDDLLPKKMLQVTFKDVLSNLMKLARYFEFDFEEMLEIKYQYNLTRPYLHNKSF